MAKKKKQTPHELPPLTEEQAALQQQNRELRAAQRQQNRALQAAQLQAALRPFLSDPDEVVEYLARLLYGVLEGGPSAEEQDATLQLDNVYEGGAKLPSVIRKEAKKHREAQRKRGVDTTTVPLVESFNAEGAGKTADDFGKSAVQGKERGDAFSKAAKVQSAWFDTARTPAAVRGDYYRKG